MEIGLSESIAIMALILSGFGVYSAWKSSQEAKRANGIALKSLEITRDTLDYEKKKALQNRQAMIDMPKEFQETQSLNEIGPGHALWARYHSSCTQIITYIYAVYDYYCYLKEEEQRREKTMSYLKNNFEPLEYLLLFFGYFWFSILESPNLKNGIRSRYQYELNFRQFIENILVKNGDIFFIMVCNLKTGQSELWAGDKKFVEKRVINAWRGSLAEAEKQEQLAMECKKSHPESLWESNIIKL